jgi:hypothetical protein
VKIAPKPEKTGFGRYFCNVAQKNIKIFDNLVFQQTRAKRRKNEKNEGCARVT